jgi:fimbrial chaperone protein
MGSFLGFPHSSMAGGNFELSPNVVVLQSSGQESTESLFVASTGDEPVAVQIRMVKRQIAQDGTETNIEDDENFLVYPPQMIVTPGKQQVVRVTWLGETDLAEELAYRAVVEQVPVNLATQQVQEVDGIPISITLTSTYIASVYVAPNGAKANLVLEDATPSKDDNGQTQLVLIFHNQGNARDYVGNIRQSLKLVSVNSPEKNVLISGEKIQDERGTVILAGNKRRFVLPWPKELPVGPVTATFTTN